MCAQATDTHSTHDEDSVANVDRLRLSYCEEEDRVPVQQDVHQDVHQQFSAFVEQTGPHLRLALVSAYGPEH